MLTKKKLLSLGGKCSSRATLRSLLLLILKEAKPDDLNTVNSKTYSETHGLMIISHSKNTECLF